MRSLRSTRQRSRDDSAAVIRRWPDVVVAWVVTVVGTVASGATLQDNYNYHWRRPVELVFTIFFWILAWLAWNILARSRVCIRVAGVDVVNGFVHHWLPWSCIAITESSEDVVVRLKDGSSVRPFSVLASPASSFVFSGTHQREIAAVLEAARLNVSNEQADSRSRHYESRIFSLLAISSVVAFLAFVFN